MILGLTGLYSLNEIDLTTDLRARMESEVAFLIASIFMVIIFCAFIIGVYFAQGFWIDVAKSTSVPLTEAPRETNLRETMHETIKEFTEKGFNVTEMPLPIIQFALRQQLTYQIRQKMLSRELETVFKEEADFVPDIAKAYSKDLTEKPIEFDIGKSLASFRRTLFILSGTFTAILVIIVGVISISATLEQLASWEWPSSEPSSSNDALIDTISLFGTVVGTAVAIAGIGYYLYFRLRHRKIIQMYMNDFLSVYQIAERTGKSSREIKKILERAGKIGGGN